MSLKNKKNIKITIIGGGIAGLSATVFLGKAGYDVTILEKTSKFGGRLYSFYSNELDTYIDNGQHILAGWYKNTFDYLNIINSYNELEFQKEFSVKYYDRHQKEYILRLYGYDEIYKTLNSILFFKGFNFIEKLKLINIFRIIKNEEKKNELNTDLESYLNRYKQSGNLLKFFWTPLSSSIFNAPAKLINLRIFLDLMKNTLCDKKNLRLILPKKDLNSVFINPAIDFFKHYDIKYRTCIKVEKIILKDKRVQCIMLNNGQKIYSDYFICAVPFYSFKKLFYDSTFINFFPDTDKLRASSILSVVFQYVGKISELFFSNNGFKMIGLVDSNIQWVFHKYKNILYTTTSSIDYIMQLKSVKKNQLMNFLIDDLKKCIPNISEKNLKFIKLLKEKRATFIPEKESEEYRVKCENGIENLFFAGDWTDTGYPSTIESAITSGRICTDIIENKSF